MNTPINYKEVATFFNRGVVIREIPTFSDSRGSLTEVFRTDDDVSNQAKLCYISKTNPFIKRGFHYHEHQTDNFINWGNNGNKMVYQFISKDLKETKFFITNPDKNYSITVEKNILHAYRNVSYSSQSLTLNFTDQLFKGYMKKEEPDEIRFEEKYPIEKILVIFGAGGKLGTALTEVAFDNMRIDNYDVVPCFDKLLKVEDVNKFFEKLDYAFPSKELTFINCAALTNTKDNGPLNDVWRWSNVSLPMAFASKCAERNWKFVQLSTDYVYQKVKKQYVNYYVSTYTQSKKEMEDNLSRFQGIGNNTTTILRVANLFKNDPSDENIFTRLNKIIRDKGEITVDPDIEVAPTDVHKLSLKILELFKQDFFNNKFKVVNVIAPSFKLNTFVDTFLKVQENDVIKCESGKLEPWMESFKNDPKAIKLNLD